MIMGWYNWYNRTKYKDFAIAHFQKKMTGQFFSRKKDQTWGERGSGAEGGFGKIPHFFRVFFRTPSLIHDGQIYFSKANEICKNIVWDWNIPRSTMMGVYQMGFHARASSIACERNGEIFHSLLCTSYHHRRHHHHRHHHPHHPLHHHLNLSENKEVTVGAMSQNLKWELFHRHQWSSIKSTKEKERSSF